MPIITGEPAFLMHRSRCVTHPVQSRESSGVNFVPPLLPLVSTATDHVATGWERSLHCVFNVYNVYVDYIHVGYLYYICWVVMLSLKKKRHDRVKAKLLLLLLLLLLLFFFKTPLYVKEEMISLKQQRKKCKRKATTAFLYTQDVSFFF